MDTRADAHRNLEANIVNSASVSWICNFYMNRYIYAVENLIKQMYENQCSNLFHIVGNKFRILPKITTCMQSIFKFELEAENIAINSPFLEFETDQIHLWNKRCHACFQRNIVH